MGGRLCRPPCPHRRSERGAGHARGGASAEGPPQTDSTLPAKRIRLTPSIDSLEHGVCLWVLPEEQIGSILSWLDVATFASAVSASCSVLSQLVGSESFEGWLVEIQRLHSVCPWTAKVSIERVIDSDPHLKNRHYCTALKCLDREFVATGLKLVPDALRSRCVETLPPFFSCQEDTLVYVCQACGSFISLVDSTVGRGYMGQQRSAFILQPTPALPFSCALHEERAARLSSGAYILMDLACPNGSCDVNLGWKYQDCIAEDDFVPTQNLRKIGQFWMYAESLKVVASSGSFPGERFYFMCNF